MMRSEYANSQTGSSLKNEGEKILLECPALAGPKSQIRQIAFLGFPKGEHSNYFFPDIL
jgi:hypothetical protein